MATKLIMNIKLDLIMKIELTSKLNMIKALKLKNKIILIINKLESINKLEVTKKDKVELTDKDKVESADKHKVESIHKVDIYKDKMLLSRLILKLLTIMQFKLRIIQVMNVLTQNKNLTKVFVISKIKLVGKNQCKIHDFIKM